MSNLRDGLSSCTAQLRAIDIQKGKDEDRAELAKSNGTFFDAIDTFVVPLLDLLTISRSIADGNYHLSNESISRIIDVGKLGLQTLKAGHSEGSYKYRNLAQNVFQSVQTEWNSKIHSQTEELINNLDILRYFLGPSKSSQIATIENGISSFEQLPVSVEKKTSFFNGLFTGQQMLTGVEFSPAIKTFLGKVADKTATFADLNDEIITWIKDNKFEEKISLSIYMKSFTN
jgi:hypothetical protein